MGELKNLSYEEAFGELNEIYKSIESGDVKVDQLREKVSRARDLIEYCREKLRQSESELDSIFKDSQDQD